MRLWHPVSLRYKKGGYAMRRKETQEEALIRDMLDKDNRNEKNMLAMLDDTKQIGESTLKTLHQQGQQISKTQGGVDNILHREEVGKQQTRSISNILWDWYYQCFPSAKYKTHTVKNKNSCWRRTKKSSTAKINSDLQTDVIGDALKGGTNEKAYQQSTAELDEIEKDVKDLEKIAGDMNEEITHHNQQLDLLSDTTNTANNNMTRLNDKVRELTR
jgi:hypothetical protein